MVECVEALVGVGRVVDRPRGSFNSGQSPLDAGSQQKNRGVETWRPRASAEWLPFSFASRGSLRGSPFAGHGDGSFSRAPSERALRMVRYGGKSCSLSACLLACLSARLLVRVPIVARLN